jgi:hypothetical protein
MLLPRVMLPPGFMPVPDRDGGAPGLHVTICRADMPAADDQPAPGDDHRIRCPFQALSVWTAAGDVVPALSGPVLWHRARQRPWRVRVVPRRVLRRHRARSPPWSCLASLVH